MGFWKRLWSFLRSETTVDDQIIEKVAEVKKEVREANLVDAILSCRASGADARSTND